jgi:phage baseplate assembly protein W
MAYVVSRKYPIDTQFSKAIGIKFPFSGQEDAVFSSTYTTRDAIKSNIINFFLTNKGERIMYPDFGANLKVFLFEHIETNKIGELKEYIRSLLISNFPQVEVVNIQLLSNTDLNLVQVNIAYQIIVTREEDNVSLNISR